MQLQPRDLSQHYKDTRQRLMTPAEPKKIAVIDGQEARIAELECENRKLKDYLISHRVDPRLVLAPKSTPPKLQVRFDDILQVVCAHFGVSTCEVKSARRHQYLLNPRHVVCYLARQMTTLSCPEVGRRLGNRDHTTIMHGDRRIAALIDSDPSFSQAITVIRKKIAGES